ncbi:MAG: mechanosensitive ion channel [Kiritimatiellae bacterium]|nr:mechanosensitive ion channel [Kiritimatiellia bacterium]
MGIWRGLVQYSTSHPLVIVLGIVGLGVYQTLAKRSRYLPQLPFGLLVVYFAIWFASTQLRGFGWWSKYGKWFLTAQAIVLAWAVAKLVFTLLVEWPYELRTRKRLTRITRDFVLLASYSVLAVLVLGSKGEVNLASLLTTSAVLTAVIGFAAQATLSSFFAGLILQLESPFSIGDWIEYKDVIGQVTGITWKSTILRTREDVQVCIPNTELTAGMFSNYSRPDPEFVSRMELGLEYGAAPNTVRRVILEVLDRHPGIRKQPPPEVRLAEFGDFAIRYEIRFRHSDFEQDRQIKAQLNNDLWYALRRHNIRIPFPIRDVRHLHVERRREEHEHRAQLLEIERMFGNVPILAALEDHDRRALAEQAEAIEFGAGETIVSQGERGESLYVIRSGACRVVAETDAAAAHEIATMGAGDFFGEMSLLTGEPRNATVQAVADVRVLRVSKQAFAAIISAHPGISEQLAELLAKRRSAHDQLPGTAVETASLSRRIVARIRNFFGTTR